MKNWRKELRLIWNGWLNAKNPSPEMIEKADRKLAVCNSCEFITKTAAGISTPAKAMGLDMEMACGICSCPVIGIAFSEHKDCPKGYFDVLQTRITDFADSKFIEDVLNTAQEAGFKANRKRVSLSIKEEWQQINSSIILVSKNDIKFKNSAYLVCEFESQASPSLPTSYKSAVLFLENGTYRGEAVEKGTLLIVNSLDVIAGTVLIKILV